MRRRNRWQDGDDIIVTIKKNATTTGRDGDGKEMMRIVEK